MLLANKVGGNHVLVDLAEANAPVVGLEVRAAASRAREDSVEGSVLGVREASGPGEVKVAADRVQGVKEVSDPVEVLVVKVAE